MGPCGVGCGCGLGIDGSGACGGAPGWSPADLGKWADGVFPHLPQTGVEVLTFRNRRMAITSLPRIDDPLAPIR